MFAFDSPNRVGIVEAVVITILVVGRLPADLARPGSMPIHGTREVAAVHHILAGVVHETAAHPQRRLLVARVEVRGEAPVVPDELRERMVAALSIGDAGAGVIEDRTRYQQVRAMPQIHAGTEREFSFSRGVRLRRHVQALGIHRRPRHHIDIGEDSVGTVERRRGAADDLDALHQVHI